MSKSPDYTSIQSLSEIWKLTAERYNNIIALHDPHAKPEVKITYNELAQKIQQFAAGLQALGVKPAAKVALFADNSPRWFIADQGIMSAGAVTVVRSSEAEREELLYILQDSDSTSLVVENLNTLQKLQPELSRLPIELIILLSEATTELEKIKIINFEQLMTAGGELEPVEQNNRNLATLIYTSGTTGKPKGVMLSQKNLLHQVIHLETIIQPEPSDRFLSILPSWHSYERSAEYFALSRGCSQIYTNIRHFKNDLKEFKPDYMVAVPRLWESIYEGVQKQFREQPVSKQKLVNFFLQISEKYILAKRIAEGLSLEHPQPSAKEKLRAKITAASLAPLHLLGDKLVYQKIRAAVGGNIKALISGGGSLAMHLENFYEIVNLSILVGYGLTETSPVTNARLPQHNLRGSAGKPLPETEIKIVDPETRGLVAQGEQGLVLIRGSQVMCGYYKNPAATAKAIDAEGWFDSGDLGLVTSENDLVLTGRAKDTIVLSNGENIEPQPIEDACVRSAYIDQIMLVGQDQRSLGALIVPNQDALEKWAAEKQINFKFPTNQEEAKESELYSKAVLELYRQELNREVKNRPGYRADDRIGPIEFIVEPFSKENGMMTQTLKIKRPTIRQKYGEMINGLFSK